MGRWILAGLAAAAVYSSVAGAIYRREALAFDHRRMVADYRLSDAEEVRREVAGDIEVKTKTLHYESDPAYLAAQAKVEEAADALPSDAGLARLRADEIRFGWWGAGVYLIVLLVVALSRMVAKRPLAH